MEPNRRRRPLKPYGWPFSDRQQNAVYGTATSIEIDAAGTVKRHTSIKNSLHLLCVRHCFQATLEIAEKSELHSDIGR